MPGKRETLGNRRVAAAKAALAAAGNKLHNAPTPGMPKAPAARKSRYIYDGEAINDLNNYLTGIDNGQDVNDLEYDNTEIYFNTYEETTVSFRINQENGKVVVSIDGDSEDDKNEWAYDAKSIGELLQGHVKQIATGGRRKNTARKTRRKTRRRN